MTPRALIVGLLLASFFMTPLHADAMPIQPRGDARCSISLPVLSPVALPGGVGDVITLPGGGIGGGVLPPPPTNDTWDYGDAPDATKVPMKTWYFPGGSPIGFFPTLSGTAFTHYAGQPGARHRVVNIGWLGNTTSYAAGSPSAPLAATDAPPSREADADLAPDPDPTTNFVWTSPDHDALDNGLYPGSLTTFGSGTIRFRVSTIPGIDHWYANAAIDWNRDGQWWGGDKITGASEWIVKDMPITVAAGTSQVFTSPAFPTGSISGTAWLRLTLSDTPVSGPGPWDGSTPPGTFDGARAKAFACGETEDDCGSIQILPRQRYNNTESIYCYRNLTKQP